MAVPLVLSSPSPASTSPSSNPPPTPLSPIDPSYPQPPSTAVSTSSNPAKPTEKKKTSRRANTAERRATHNAVERQRRETLNGRFLDLAALLPNLTSVRRPSKSAIVNSSIALIHAQRRSRATAARELRTLYSQYASVKAECDEWRRRAGMRPVDEPEHSSEFVALMECREDEEMGEEERGALRMAVGSSEEGFEDGEDADEPTDSAHPDNANNATSALSAAAIAAANAAAAAQQQQQHHLAAQHAQAQLVQAHYAAAAQLRAQAAEHQQQHHHATLPQISAPGMLPFDSITGMFTEPHLSPESLHELSMGLPPSSHPSGLSLHHTASTTPPATTTTNPAHSLGGMDKWAIYQMQMHQQAQAQAIREQELATAAALAAAAAAAASRHPHHPHHAHHHHHAHGTQHPSVHPSLFGSSISTGATPLSTTPTGSPPKINILGTYGSGGAGGGDDDGSVSSLSSSVSDTHSPPGAFATRNVVGVDSKSPIAHQYVSPPLFV